MVFSPIFDGKGADMKLKVIGLAAILAVFFSTTVVRAMTLDWSTITLGGTFPNFSFSDPTLGTVNLSYSNAERSGISNQFAESTLILGNTGDESLTMSWSNSVTDLNLEIWDIDSLSSTANNESLAFVTTASVSPNILHSTDVWVSATNTITGEGTNNSNSLLGNFSLMNFANAGGFNSITFNWSLEGAGTGSFGIGNVNDIQPVPEPSTVLLMGTGLIGLIGYSWRKQKKNA